MAVVVGAMVGAVVVIILDGMGAVTPAELESIPA